MLTQHPSRTDLRLAPVATCPSVVIDVAATGDVRERWISVMLSLTIVLNLIDAALTLFYVGAGVAVEANPLMQQLLEQGPVVFVIGKLAIVSLSVFLVWRLRQLKLATFASAAALATYLMTLMWHLQGLATL